MDKESTIEEAFKVGTVLLLQCSRAFPSDDQAMLRGRSRLQLCDVVQNSNMVVLLCASVVKLLPA